MNELRETITIILQFGAAALFTFGFYLFSQPWQTTVALFAGAVALSVLSLWTAPPTRIRAPRGGPMIDPEHTIVVDKSTSKKDSEI